MQSFLQAFATLPSTLCWLIFLLENVALTVLVLVAGRYIQRRFAAGELTAIQYSRREWIICGITNVLNTVVTFAGYWLWKESFIVVTCGSSCWWSILSISGLLSSTWR